MYAIVADAHLGHITREHESFLFEKLRDLRREKLKIIWLGDTFDLIWQHTAYSIYKEIIKDDDILLIGNHDFSLIKDRVGIRSFVLGNTALTHGDYLDFGFFTARLQYFWKNLQRFDVTFIEILAKILYPNWKFDDVHSLFLLMENLDEKTLNMFSHNPKYSHGILSEFFELFSLLRKARKYLTESPIAGDVFPEFPVPKPDKAGHVFGYFTFDIHELYKRYKQIYPKKLHKKNILIGHIHKPEDKVLDNGTRFIIVGSWKQNKEYGIYPTVPILNRNGDIIEIRDYL